MLQLSPLWTISKASLPHCLIKYYTLFKVKETVPRFFSACSPFLCRHPLLEAYYPLKGTWSDISHTHNSPARPQNVNNNNNNNLQMNEGHLKILEESYVTFPNMDISKGPWTMHLRVRLHSRIHNQYLLANYRRGGLLCLVVRKYNRQPDCFLH